MALHTSLPIYKPAYDFYLLTVDLIANLPRSVKDPFGKRLREVGSDGVMLILRANCEKGAEKVPYLNTLLDRLEEAQLLIRMFQDKRFISPGQYAKAIELSSNVGRQANGWKKKYVTSPAT